MEIKIKNCNNIDYGLIKIKKNKLNIKYGMNGTGKTTISKAIESYLNDKANGTITLKNLTSFKYLVTRENESTIEGLETINKVLIFNELYIEQFIFKQDELVKNSFEIFIKDENYQKNEVSIKELLRDIKETFIDNPEIDSFINELKTLNDTTKTKASVTNKSLLNGNKLLNIPEKLSRYTDYLKSENSISWLGWHSKGREHLSDFDKCPYCTSELKSNINASKEKIELLSTEFKAKEIENLIKTISLFKNLESYFSNETNDRIKDMLKEITGISLEQEDYLKRITSQAQTIVKKLITIKSLDFIKLKDFAKINESLEEIKIDLKVIEYFKSKKSIEKFVQINSSIDNLIEKATFLTAKINIQKSVIKKTIKKYQKEINEFLDIAGYLYKVDFEQQLDGSYKIKLVSLHATSVVENVNSHLSYGERNAFAMILFMYSALKENADLIVLDDPISSFDKNKKYAIIEKLFTGKESFSGKTVLLLTHDFEPILDMTYNRKLQSTIQPIAHFLENIDGQLIEKEIKKTDIKSCIQVAKDNINDASNNIVKLIYLRRLNEIRGNKNLSYNLISSLLHKKTNPTIESADEILEMTFLEKESAIEEVRKDLPDFCYEKELAIANSDETMIKLYKKTENNYEKLQLYRVIKEDDRTEEDTIKKFINATFHIENDFLFQLNPLKYEIIPQYVINICDLNLLR